MNFWTHFSSPSAVCWGPHNSGTEASSHPGAYHQRIEDRHGPGYSEAVLSVTTQTFAICAHSTSVQCHDIANIVNDNVEVFYSAF